jgi:hypothetical protein
VSRALIGVLVSLLAVGCSATNRYTPELVAPAELVVQYDDGLEIYAGADQVAAAPTYDGLAHFVHCVPDARRLAEDAEDAGSAGLGLSVTSVSLAVLGLGGLAGLAYEGKDEGAMVGLLLGGVVLEVIAVTTGAISLSRRYEANGSALDAVNVYNDAVGSAGGRCQ